ncbi:type VI Secretion system protein VasG [Ceratobasidium sp. AG-Ba]|nr:type VI Secretion system protein VasG [Ceratobasidium sp. AG-Ba]
MSLAYFGTLTPGPSGVATIRFSVPVILQTFRIVPNRVSAFKHVRGCTGETSPSQFSLKIYSNASMLPTETEPKPKATNTLLCTQLDYVDEMLDWKFSITPRASSRLVIVQGSYEKLTIAIYGRFLPEGSVEPPAPTLAPTVLPPVATHALPRSIDVSILPNSSQTAKSLLMANTANPPLRHILHSLLCYVTTPEGPFDEWDESNGNPLERLLESDTIDAVELMQEAVQALRKPLPEIDESTATQFTSVVNESLGENPDTYTCKLLFEILGYASLQSDSLVKALLFGITSVTYLADPRLLEDDIVSKHIERWISHPLVAQNLNEPSMREYMLGGRDQEAAPENMARWEQLQASISQWGEFHSVFDYMEEEDVLERLPQVSRWLRSSLSVPHFGPTLIWRLWNRPNIVEFSSDDPVLSDYHNLILGTRHFLPDSVSLLDLFRATLKAYMGVAAVLSVVWWSRFPPDAVACRALSVLKLWAESDGICEIVRTLSLVPVFYEALSELTVDVPLHKSGLYAQQLLEALNVSVDENEAPVSEATAAPEPPQLSGHLEVMAQIVELHELDDIAVKRVNVASQRILRLAKETPEEPWSLFTDAHQSTSKTLMLTQIEVFGKLSDYMDKFVETPLDATSSSVMANLLAALVNVAETVSLLLPHSNLPSRTARSLARLATSVFISCDLILSRNRRQTQVVEQSHVVRETCIQLLRTFATLNETYSAFQYPGAEHVLHQVLSVWLEYGTKDSMHIYVSQTAVLLELLLPLPQSNPEDALSLAQDFWVREVVRVMHQLEQLLAVLPPRHWTSLALRLVELDGGNNSIGLGPWLAFNELHTLRALVGRVILDADAGKLAVMLHVADRSIGLLGTLLRDVLRDETAGLIIKDSRVVSALVQCFELLVDNHATTNATAGLAAALAPYATDEPRALRRLLVTVLLRGCRSATPFSSLLAIPTLLVPHRTFATRDMDLDVFGTDISLALIAICAAWNENVQSPIEVCEALVHILEWVTEYEDPTSIHLHGFGQQAVDRIRALTLEHAPDRVSALDVSLAIIASSEDVPDDLKAATEVHFDGTPFTSTLADLRSATNRKQPQGSRESTPPPTHGPFDILALASISPRAPTSPVTPTAPLTLTKMYSQNEFRSV